VSYGDARLILDETDRDPNNSSNCILVYLGTSVSGNWDGGITWNREHVWPQSLLGVNVENQSINVGSDLHNLKPADPNENSSRAINTMLIKLLLILTLHGTLSKAIWLVSFSIWS
jgi:endonuclease I